MSEQPVRWTEVEVSRWTWWTTRFGRRCPACGRRWLKCKPLG